VAGVAAGALGFTMRSPCRASRRRETSLRLICRAVLPDPQIGEAERVPNIAFSLSAAAASLLIAILAAAKGVPLVAIVWGALAIGFAIRAVYGFKRR
jgi:hypothetical protein